MTTQKKDELEVLAEQLGINPQVLGGILCAGFVVLGGWWWFFYRHHVRFDGLRNAVLTALSMAGKIALAILVTALVTGLAALALRVVCTHRTERRRRTFLVLADPALDPSESQFSAFLVKIHAFRRRGLLRWLDTPATAFCAIITHDEAGRPVYLWQLPQRHVGQLFRAVQSTFGDAVRLEPGGHLLPNLGVKGHWARMELEPSAGDEQPFRRIPLVVDPKSDLCHAVAKPTEGELRVVAIATRGLPPGQWTDWVTKAIGGRKKPKPAKDRDEIDRHLDREEARSLRRKVDDKQGNREPLFRVQPLVLAVAPERDAAKRTLDNLYGAFAEWLGSNFLRPVGANSFGSNAFWRRSAFDFRLRTNRIGAVRVWTGSELGKLVLPPDVHNTCAEVVRLKEDVLAPPEETAPKEERKGVTVAASNGHRVVLTPEDLKHHFVAQAPTGAGKSTLIGNVFLDWADLGFPGVLVDPSKGDTIDYVMDRLPERHWDRVCLIAPARQDRSVAINVLDTPARHGTVADQIVSVFARNYGQYWGPKGATFLRMAILTLLHRPGSTLPDVIPLLTNEAVRDKWTYKLEDEGLKMAWQTYDPSQAESLLWKLSDVLTFRPEVRHLLGQVKSTIDLSEVLNKDGLVLISLPPGELGEDTSTLLGGLLISRIWQIVQARSAIPEEERRYLLTIIDEFPKLVTVPTSWTEFLREARGYRAPFGLGHQDRSDLSGGDLASAVDNNARTKIFFQMEHADARIAATQARPVTVAQLEGLARYHAAIRLCVDGHVKPAFIAPTPPPRPSLGIGERLAQHALAHYGRAFDEAEERPDEPDEPPVELDN